MKISGATLKLLLSAFFILSQCFLYAAVETIHFDILLFGDKIGDMTITHELKPDGTDYYGIVTQSKAKILWINRDNFSRYDLVYKQGKLVSSVFKEIENGEVKRWANVKWDGTHYAVDSHKGKSTFTESPKITSITMYFNQIPNTDKVFYESEGDYAKLEHPDANTWEFKSSDGHRTIYYFVNGKIHHVEIHISIATVKMMRTN